MNEMLKTAAAAVALVFAAAAAVPAMAADLWDGHRGSIKDGPVGMQRAAGPCYVRADAGYSISNWPDVRWPVTNGVTGAFLGDEVKEINVENTWLVEGGFGCALSHNWRADLVFGYRGDRKIDGEPILWAPPGVPLQDPLHTSIES
jgi:opacity protein-like surface antigen